MALNDSNPHRSPLIVVVNNDGVPGVDVLAMLERAGHGMEGIACADGDVKGVVAERNPDAVVFVAPSPEECLHLEACDVLERDFDVPVVVVHGGAALDTRSDAAAKRPIVSSPLSPEKVCLALERAMRRKAEERMRMVLENLPGVGFFALDAEAENVFVNRFLREALGLPDKLDKNYGEILAELVPDPERRRSILSFFAERAGDYEDVEVTVKGASRKDRTFLLSNKCKRFPVSGWSSWGVAREITRRKSLEHELARHNELLQTAMYAGRLCAWEVDPETRSFTHSRYLRELLHFGTDEPSNNVQDWLERISASHQEIVLTRCMDVIEGRHQELDAEYPFRDGRGRVVWLRTTGHAISSPKGRLFVGTSRDITERVRAGQVREDVERVVRHDLRAPLNGIMGLVQVLLLEEMEPSEARLVGEIQGCAERMMHLIDFSLELHKLEEGRYIPPDHPVDIVQVLRWAVRNVAMRASSRDVDVRLDIDVQSHSSACVVRGERVLLENMFSNLVMNAVEASPWGGRAHIALSANSGEVRVRMSNNKAVPEQVRDRFFEKYATYGKAKGTGLGTYSARLIARAHGGDILMQTSDADDTTILMIVLPVS